jgi:two-component system, NtrC family, nitrogen regulation sensor histidine kinase GlnL
VIFFMKDISFLVDKNLRVTKWDDEITELTGRSSRQAMGKKYFDVFPRIMIGEQDALSKAVKEKKSVTLKEYRFQCPYSHVGAAIRISPIRKNGSAPGQIKIALRPSASCSVAKRLNRSQKFIAIGKVASTLAHGVKNPLNAIKGAVVYLRERYSQEEPFIEFTQIMEAEISRLENFISQFLGTTASPGEMAPVDINALISRIKIFVSLQTYAHNIQCNYQLGEIPPIVANPFHLEQALLNVINNAIEAMNSGGTLGIRTYPQAGPEGRFIVVEIADTGPGMDVKNVEDMGADRTKGRGFGLFIAQEMVKYYNGRLEILGKKGKGTTVRFYLPCKDAAL